MKAVSSLDAVDELSRKIEQKIICELCLTRSTSPCSFACGHQVCHACALRHCEDELPPTRSGSSGGRRKSGSRVASDCVICSPTIPSHSVRKELKISYPLRDIVEAYSQLEAAVLNLYPPSSSASSTLSVAIDSSVATGVTKEGTESAPPPVTVSEPPPGNSEIQREESVAKSTKTSKRKGKAPVQSKKGGKTTVLSAVGLVGLDMPPDSLDSPTAAVVPTEATGTTCAEGKPEPEPKLLPAIENQDMAVADCALDVSAVDAAVSRPDVEEKPKPASQTVPPNEQLPAEDNVCGSGQKEVSSGRADCTEIYQREPMLGGESPNVSARGNGSQFSVDLSSDDDADSYSDAGDSGDTPAPEKALFNIADEHCLPSPGIACSAVEVEAGAARRGVGGPSEIIDQSLLHVPVPGSNPASASGRTVKTPEERKKQYSRDLGIDSQFTVLTPPLILGSHSPAEVGSPVGAQSQGETMLPETHPEPMAVDDDEDTHLSPPDAGMDLPLAAANEQSQNHKQTSESPKPFFTQDLVHVSSIHGSANDNDSALIPSSSLSSPTATAPVAAIASIVKKSHSCASGATVTFQSQSPMSSASTADRPSVREITSGWGLGMQEELNDLKRMVMNAETQATAETSSSLRSASDRRGRESSEDCNVSNVSTQLSPSPIRKVVSSQSGAPPSPAVGSVLMGDSSPDEDVLAESQDGPKMAISFTGLSIDNRLHLQHCVKNEWLTVVDLGGKRPCWREIIAENIIRGIALMDGPESGVGVCRVRDQRIECVVTDVGRELAGSVATGEGLCQHRSLTYLLALSMGIPVIDSRWLVDSLISGYLLEPFECTGECSYAVSGSVLDDQPGAVFRALCGERCAVSGPYPFSLARNARGCSNLLSCFEFDCTELFGPSGAWLGAGGVGEFQTISMEHLLLLVYYSGGYVTRTTYDALVLPILKSSAADFSAMALNGSDASSVESLLDALECFLLVPSELRQYRSVQQIKLSIAPVSGEDITGGLSGNKRKFESAIDPFEGLDMDPSQDPLSSKNTQIKPLKWFFELIYNYLRPGQTGSIRK